jgi:TonB family protein
MKKPTVLLVDYDPMSIESTRGPLALAGYDVAVAKNGVAGLEAFHHVDPDLVLTQLMLPRLPGLDLCREIRKTRPAGRPPIIVYGTTPAEKGRSQALAAGANGYLVAPMNPETLVETCNDFLMGCGIEPLEEIVRSPEPDELPSQDLFSDESEQAAAASEILERLDAFIPSTQVEIPAPPIVESAVAEASPAVSATATERPVLPPVLGKGSERARVRWTRVLPVLTLGAGLLVVLLALRGRTLPGREPGQPASSDVDRSMPSEAISQVAEPSNENTPAAATTDGFANLTPAAASLERGSAAGRPGPSLDGSKVATEPRSGTSREESPVPVPAPALGPETKPAPAAAAPVAPPEPDAANGELFKSLSPELPEPAAPEDSVTAVPPPAVPIRAGDLVELGSVDTPPVAKTRTQPAYPEFARRMRYSGTAALRILVDENGKVTEAAAEDNATRPEFVAAAVRAVKTWTYRPAMKNGAPVKTRLTVRIAFEP